ncbi:hypothetical protein NQ317_006325 [Molorchus minor]|uniref:Reverse transcriptase domain-containing protein n=1 Tax=Molorchus minor TaxID=1323400 RepID=A0ABQ9J9A2_9CUCU|nr:hypothetical protein NQ317_006325 [Molorchus minor]
MHLYYSPEKTPKTRNITNSRAGEKNINKINDRNSFINNNNRVAFSDHKFHNRFLNLSSVTFTPKEEEVLSLGLQYNSHNQISNKNLEILAVESERILELSSDVDKEISKADKGNCLVILDKDLYIHKVEEFLDPVNYPKLNSNPTNKHFTYTKSVINLTSDTLAYLNQDKRKLTPMNPSTPRLYGLPKIHKTNVPIRPVVAYVDSPTSNLAAWLSKILPEITEFKDPLAVKNSVELTNKISNVNVPKNAISITNFIHNLIQFYSQPNGLAMGSNLSPLLSEIFMHNLESSLPKFQWYNKILFWYRYVDDILVLFNGSKQEVESLLAFLNSLHSSIVFTVEFEENNKINFLDLEISKLDNKLDFSVYRKPTNTDLVIPFNSNHPFSQKFAAFHSFFNRLFKLPLSPHNFKKEQIIKQIAYNNNFPIYLINKMLLKYQIKFANINLIQPNILPSPYFSIPYIGPVSASLKHIFNTNNINISFKTLNPLRSRLVNTKDTINPLDKSGVYKINCSHPSCNVCYIGQSGRKIITRVQEHVKIIETNKNNNLDNNHSTPSSFANHILNNNHSFNLDDINIIHTCKKGVKLNLLEILEINKALKNPSCNPLQKLGSSLGVAKPYA